MLKPVFINTIKIRIMATSKTAKTSKTKSTSKASQPANSEIVVNHKIQPPEEEIRQKAEQIYYERIDRGEHGTDLSDWLEAEALLRDSD